MVRIRRFSNKNYAKNYQACKPTKKIQVERTTEVDRFSRELDYVPPTMPEILGLAKLILLEDNEPVIKLTVKRRRPRFRYVPRTQRIDLDGLFDTIANDPGITIRHIVTKLQIADIFTKAQKGCLHPPSSAP